MISKEAGKYGEYLGSDSGIEEGEAISFNTKQPKGEVVMKRVLISSISIFNERPSGFIKRQ